MHEHPCLATIGGPRAGSVTRRHGRVQKVWKPNLPAVAVAGLLVGLCGAVAQADNLEGWAPPMECGHAFGAGPTSGLRCLKNSLDEAAADYAAHLIEQQGQTYFGDNFRFVHRLSWSPFTADTSRNLDTVIPLQFSTGEAAPQIGKTALFLQHGVTRWQDNAGFTRNDIRHGVAYRFALSDDNENILGMSALYQENFERGHKRLVMALDYAGRYGTGRLQQFVPASGWKPGRLGYEERAIGGTELGASLGITSTMSLDGALTRWDDESENARDIHGRIGLGLRPHPWLNLRAGYETGLAGEAANVHVQLTIPLGGKPKPVPRWEGLGVLGVAQTPPGIWRPVENVEHLQTVERVIASAAAARAGSIAVEFLQTQAATGSKIGVRVSMPAPLSEDLSIVLRLAPGSGSNPAMPGEDFVDEPQQVTIVQGETSATAHFRLLHNADMQTARSLAVTVSPGTSS